MGTAVVSCDPSLKTYNISETQVSTKKLKPISEIYVEKISIHNKTFESLHTLFIEEYSKQTHY
jgi:hypothetical protein